MPVLAAAAKLNLYLHVTGKRPDGYHMLDGLIAFADIHDTLTVEPSEAFRFTVSGPFASGLGASDSNLVVKAARSFAEMTGREPAVALHLVKRLPVASGIGGGSADAAACLRGLAALWDLNPADVTIMKLAERLGADVPMCVQGRAAFIGGIGAEFAPAPKLPECWVVLVNPGLGLPTPDVFRARNGAFSPPQRFSETPKDAAALAVLLQQRGNDLTAPAIGIAPEIQDVLDAIAATSACLLARMSGSGATCFGLYASKSDADAAAMSIRQAHPAWWVAPGRLLKDTAAIAP